MKKLLYGISHTTTYDYVGDVSVSHHLCRLTPRSNGHQHCLGHELQIQPPPALVSTHRDYFGNTTHFVGLETPHQKFTVKSVSHVAVGLGFVPEPLETPPWDVARARSRADHSRASLEAMEFIDPSPLVPLAEEIFDYTRPSFAGGRPILDAVLDLTHRLHQDFTFDPAATTASTPILEVFRHRRGVCQDFAHLQIAALRSHGLPARYVSGYLETDPPPGQVKLRGVDASHAWVSVYCPAIGWIDVDPTNNCLPSLRHITLGWGRDFSDVCPIRGVLVGSQSQTVQVGVDVHAYGPWEPGDAAGPVGPRPALAFGKDHAGGG